MLSLNDYPRFVIGNKANHKNQLDDLKTVEIFWDKSFFYMDIHIKDKQFHKLGV